MSRSRSRPSEQQPDLLGGGAPAQIHRLFFALMPEGLLQGLSDQEVRDLFAYLRSSQPLTK